MKIALETLRSFTHDTSERFGDPLHATLDGVEYVFATDGGIVLAVRSDFFDGDASLFKEDKDAGLLKTYTEWLKLATNALDAKVLEILDKQNFCDACDGNGIVNDTCQHCQRTGEVECQYCGGYGVKYGDADTPAEDCWKVRIDGLSFACHKLRRVADLPGFSYIIIPQKIMVFSWTGGFGAMSRVAED